MVSLAFVISFVVSAVAMLIGIVIFTDVADAMGETFLTNDKIVDTIPPSLQGSKQAIQGEINPFGNILLGQRITMIDEKIVRVNMVWGETYAHTGNIQLEIRTGATGSSYGTVVDTSNEKYSIVGASTMRESEFTFTNQPILNEEVVITAIIVDNVGTGGTGSPMQTDPSINNCQSFTNWCPVDYTYPDGVQRGEWTKKNANANWSSLGTHRDMPMKIWVESENTPQGFEETNNIALTVMGVLPVALFFGLFSILSTRVDGE